MKTKIILLLIIKNELILINKKNYVWCKNMFYNLLITKAIVITMLPI